MGDALLDAVLSALDQVGARPLVEQFVANRDFLATGAFLAPAALTAALALWVGVAWFTEILLPPLLRAAFEAGASCGSAAPSSSSSKTASSSSATVLKAHRWRLVRVRGAVVAHLWAAGVAVAAVGFGVAAEQLGALSLSPDQLQAADSSQDGPVAFLARQVVPGVWVATAERRANAALATPLPAGQVPWTVLAPALAAEVPVAARPVVLACVGVIAHTVRALALLPRGVDRGVGTGGGVFSLLGRLVGGLLSMACFFAVLAAHLALLLW